MEAIMTATTAVERGKRITTRSQRRRNTFYLFVSPWLIGFVLLSISPLHLVSLSL